jgi:RNA-directed DNA polymerase
MKPQVPIIENPGQLCAFLWIPLDELKSAIRTSSYKIYHIPKNNGRKRRIEVPNPKIKAIQSQLNFYFQNLYLTCRSPSAYAYISNRADCEEPANILTNAKKHINKTWLLNMDFLDFFHQISASRIRRILNRNPFKHDQETTNLIIKLVTHKGRLPMGAPTSPVLSNFACLDLDFMLTSYCNRRNFQYTRYADDLSFSSQIKFSDQDIETIRYIVRHNRFLLNHKKTSIFGPMDEKIVTGLKVNFKVDICRDFLKSIKEDIIRYHKVKEAAWQYGLSCKILKKRMEASIAGKIAFVRFVKGKDDQTAKRLEEMMDSNRDMPPKVRTSRWAHFPYPDWLLGPSGK